MLKKFNGLKLADKKRLHFQAFPFVLVPPPPGRTGYVFSSVLSF